MATAVFAAFVFKALHANHSSTIPRPAAGQPIFALERARVTRTWAGRNAELGVAGPSAGAKRRRERVWRDARRAAAESNVLDQSAVGMLAESGEGRYRPSRRA